MNIESIILKCVYLVNKIIPKKKNQIFFYSFPDYSDNARAIYEEIVRHGIIKNYSIIWAVRDVEKFKSLLNDVKIVKHKSLCNLWYFCRSRYIFRTHSLWGNKYVRGKQKMCIAWHGMPLKREYDPSKPINNVECDILTTTAEHFSNELSMAMGLERSQCVETGLPRNDDLFKNTDIFKRLGFGGFKKIIIWMPTYRNSSFRSDGIESKFGIPTVPDEGLEKINTVLAAKEYLLILKLHPFAENKIGEISFTNIRCLRNDDIPYDSSLYEIIGQSDALITDYSSISVDYLLVDKPMCFVIDDINEYRKTRGFSLEPIEDYLPGEKVRDFASLLEWFSSFDGSDSYSAQREYVRTKFHKHTDNKNSERVLREMGIL